MLVLSRKRSEEIVITVPPSDKEQVISVVVVELRGDKARLGIKADPSAVRVHRLEVESAMRIEHGSDPMKSIIPK